MARYDIYEKAGERRAVPDGLSGAAFWFGSFWLLAKGLWLEALAGFAFVIFVALPVLPYAPWAALGLLVCPALYAWIEGHALVARRLERKGWKHVAAVEAASRDGALIMYEASLMRSGSTPPPLPSTTPDATAIGRSKVQGTMRGPAPFGLEGL
ncbi:MAG: DUF2628 domain-containing protein [Pseudomonadota bacterium]